MIVSCNARANIRKEHNNVRLLYCQFRLTSHLREYHIIAGGLNASCVNYHKFSVSPLAFGIYPVTRNAWSVLYNGQPFAHKLVKKRGFSHVRSAHYRNYRQSHTIISVLLISAYRVKKLKTVVFNNSYRYAKFSFNIGNRYIVKKNPIVPAYHIRRQQKRIAQRLVL